MLHFHGFIVDWKGRNERVSKASIVLALALAALSAGHAQTTQGIIRGEVRDSITGVPIAHAVVGCTHLTSGVASSTITGEAGIYVLPLLSPGSYRLTITAAGYQTRELYGLELQVGGRIEVASKLRPSTDLWESSLAHTVVLPESNQVFAYYGPDVDPNRVASFRVNSGEEIPLETSISDVIGERLARDLPLLGRDVYSLLSVLPGVASDTATGRGINVSVAGQRPAASNFLLEGLEANNYLVTGPLSEPNPDAIQEYRISNSNYSAEYGRTSGFIANAVSRAGSSAWHAGAWLLVGHDLLNANGFQENQAGLPRAQVRQSIPGGSLGGPILKEKLFFFVSAEHQRYRSRGDPESVLLPTQKFVLGLDPSKPAGRLLRPMVAALPADPSADSAIVTVEPPAELNQTSATARSDYVFKHDTQRITVRGAWFGLTEPGLLYNPYPGYSSGPAQQSPAFGAAWTWAVSPTMSNELRVGRNGQRYDFARPHSETPAMASSDQVFLPGSRMYAGLDYRERTWEMTDNLTVALGRHIVKAGGGWLEHNLDSSVTADLQGNYSFASLSQFAARIPFSLALSYDRNQADPSAVPAFGRQYGYRQVYGFVQDSYQATRRLTFNFGARYEYFGNPANTGRTKDTLVTLGTGDSFAQRLATAKFAEPPASGDQPLYTGSAGNWAGRFAFAYAARGAGVVIRGAYGLFYDRPFENNWSTVATNSLLTGSSSFTSPVDFLLPAHQVAAAFPPSNLQPPVEPVLFQPDLRAARTQSAFLGVEKRASSAITLELAGLGSFSRALITTDQINREYSVSVDPANNPSGLINPQMPRLDYRANQGKANYLGGWALVRFGTRAAEGQVAYTFSHAIDNQSDPLAGTFFNFNVPTGGVVSPEVAAFTMQFDSQADRANADFDQRHNLVAYAAMESPVLQRAAARRLLSHWRVGAIAALRSGFPYTAWAQPSGAYALPVIENNRANLVGSPAEAHVHIAVPGGVELLNPAAFGPPATGVVGNTGRNAFVGPGLFNIDLSLARSFRIPKLGESRMLTVRANFFNALNHVNLNAPVPTACCADPFGSAYYGRAESGNGFPLMLPLAETARQVQVMLRFDF